MSNYFGKKIKEIRINNNLTQKEFADIFGYKDESVIDDIENGKTEMSVDNIALLVNKFNVDANELFIEKVVEEKEEPVITSIFDYYNQYDEDARLTRRNGQIEFLTTNKYVHEYLKKGDKIIEIGAGTGAYSVTKLITLQKSMHLISTRILIAT